MDEKSAFRVRIDQPKKQDFGLLDKDLLRKLEYIDGLSNQDIYLVALVSVGLKPSATIGLSYQEGYSSYTENDYEYEAQEVSELLKELGLKFKQEKYVPDIEDEDQTIWTTFYISQSEKTAAALQQAVSDRNEQAAARILGYPESAIQAFPHDSFRIETSEELKQHKNAPFLYFLPSREYWQQELDSLDEQVAVVEQLLPDLFERMKKGFHN